MRHLYPCALALMLFASACSKDDKNNTPVDETKVSFAYNKIGSNELFDALTAITPLATITKGDSFRPFSYELTGSNGLKRTNDTLVKGSDALDGAGNASIYLYGLANYKDGELTLKVHFTTPDSTVQVKVQKNEYQIWTYRDFMHMIPVRYGDTSDHYIQMADIAFPDTVFTEAPCKKTITGSYDGQGFKITNLTIHSPGEVVTGTGYPRIGLFTGIEGNGIIKNIRLELSATGITGERNTYAGGIAGYCDGGTISQCSVKGNLSLDKQTGIVGGIAGFNLKVTVIGCSFRGRIVGSNVGGIVGSAAADVNMCYAYFSFDANAACGIGELPARGSIFNVSNSYVVAHDYTSPAFVAIGPVTALPTGTVTNCYANAGDGQDGVTILPSMVGLNTNLSTLVVADWPAGIIAPADKRPYKYDTDPTAPMKLWWE